MVCEVVRVVDSVVVKVLLIVVVVVGDVEAVVVGEVTSQFKNPPCWKASIIKFNAFANSTHLLSATIGAVNKQSTFITSAPGPRNSLTAN